MLLSGFGTILQLLYLAMLVLAVVAFVFAATAREDAYRAADKKKKSFWLIILGIAVAVNLLPTSLFFLQIAGVVASIVFMVDVRPALKEVSGGGGGRRGGSSSDGPYGPYNGGR
ncbi:DUF2516 family protein [Streptomyces sp. SID14515]|uniref:DUF2516 family protein n=1 Tax=Streptomyces sp. SID14515 TaxID=2706074 RepID=UPI0013CCECD0|nr:DUF2516 family protein [Streptomyces sp. SID14515]NEB40122.1 DUF2516 family protein [Streptomyces sp. SID14515]